MDCASGGRRIGEKRPIDPSVNEVGSRSFVCQRRPSSEDLCPRQRGAGCCRAEADRPVNGSHGSQWGEEPQPLRHPRDRGRDADQGGRRGRGRGDRRGDDGARVRGPRAAQGRVPGRRPLGAPDRRGAGRLRRGRHRLRAGPDAEAREPRSRAPGPAVRRRRVLHDRRGRGRAPADALADAGHQDGRRSREAALRAPGRIRLRHRRDHAARRHLRRRRDQRAALPVAQGDHGGQEEAARHRGRRRRGHRGVEGRGRELRRAVDRLEGAAAEGRRDHHRGRGHERDGRQDRRVARREEADLAMADILVYALHYEGEINKNSLGAVSEGARLASELGGECHAIVVGGDDLTDELAGSVGAYGATKVYRAKAPEGLAQPVVDAMAKVIADNGHGYALFGGGLLGFEVGAGLAARLGAGVAMEVTAARAEGGKLVAARPILGDSAISEINFRSDVGIIIGRLNAFESKQSDVGAATVEDVEVELSPQAQQATMVQRGEQRGADVDIEGADVLVAGGRGLGKAEGFELVEALAKAFGGNSAVAATRAVVDAGWYPYAAQIGQTGKTVSPKLYLAAGISGAIQHKVGMQSSENIVAINKDANAPIFEFSYLGIVGDLNKILPKLTEAVKARKG